MGDFIHSPHFTHCSPLFKLKDKILANVLFCPYSPQHKTLLNNNSNCVALNPTKLITTKKKKILSQLYSSKLKILYCIKKHKDLGKKTHLEKITKL